MVNNLIDYLEKKYKKIENKNITVFFSQEEYTDINKESLGISNWLWSRLIVKNKKNDKTGNRYKYRVYYKLLFNDKEVENIFTIIMFNPSYANQFSKDPTINNCIKIAKDNGYNGIEVFNILTIRDSDIERVIKNYKNKKNALEEFKEYLKGKNILLAWGSKSKNFQEDILKLLTEINDCKFYTINSKLVNNKYPRHPRALNGIAYVPLTQLKICQNETNLFLTKMDA